jgi:hypothetical protein
MTESRRQQYFQLIEDLVGCPNGQEPDVLDANKSLIDADFVQTLMEVAAAQAHAGNQDGAKFLIFLARQLSKELGLYPELVTES